MNNKRILITGINGFIGRNLAKYLGDSFPQAAVFGVARTCQSQEGRYLQADLLDKEALDRVIREIQPDVVFHLAGVIFSRDWTEFYQGNVETTINVLEAVKKSQYPTRIIIPGSAAEYGKVDTAYLPLLEEQEPNPISPYGVSKLWQTTTARYYASQGLDVVMGRIFNVIGPGVPQGLSIGAFLNQLKKIKSGELPPRIEVGNLKPKRDFLDILDVCQAMVALASSGKGGEIYNICSGASVSMEVILEMMITALGVNPEVVGMPERIRPADIDDIYGDNSKLVTQTGWSRRIQLEESIRRITC
ncbi:MAG TPA: GDP-mannose 4,6-dehydratase [Bacillota bacterium]|nr:GDP-mannose 4,6-dehydratase [Bacillota bacterium]